MSLLDQLHEAWAALDAEGAVVRRVPAASLTPGELELLVMHEQRRVRALAERHTPRPAPVDGRITRIELTYRASSAALADRLQRADVAARRRREAVLAAAEAA